MIAQSLLPAIGGRANTLLGRSSSLARNALLSGQTFSSLSRFRCNTLIVGGGPVGCSTAFHLAQQRGNEGKGIVVLERDPTYAHASATRSAGGIRQQFSLRQNVQMSRYGLWFLREMNARREDCRFGEVDVQFQEHGYLFLASTKEGESQLRQNHQVQQQCQDESAMSATSASDSSEDALIRLLSREELKDTFPWLNTDDMLLGSFGQSGEGWFDPWALIQGTKHACQEMGVQFVTGEPVGSTRDTETGRVLTVDVQSLGQERTNITSFSVDVVVNAAGPHCQAVLEVLAADSSNAHGPLQHPIPVEPRKRCIFFFHCPTATDFIAPLTICPGSGVYFRSEGSGRGQGHFLCGVSPQPDQDVALKADELLEVTDHDHQSLFDDTIWPALYERVPEHFGNIKVQSSWAGLYEYNTVDQNAIIDFHPELHNVLLVNGFSGHGLQQSPAAGRAAAELLDYQRFTSLDLSIFHFERLLPCGKPIFEAGIV